VAVVALYHLIYTISYRFSLNKVDEKLSIFLGCGIDQLVLCRLAVWQT
jgi:hypothetical protein